MQISSSIYEDNSLSLVNKNLGYIDMAWQIKYSKQCWIKLVTVKEKKCNITAQKCTVTEVSQNTYILQKGELPIVTVIVRLLRR